MGLDIGGLKEKYEKKQAQRADRLTIADGENYIRILPPSLEYLTETVDYISFEYLMHYRVGIGDDKTAVVCPRTYGKKQKCPICEAVSKLYKANTPDDISLAKDLSAK